MTRYPMRLAALGLLSSCLGASPSAHPESQGASTLAMGHADKCDSASLWRTSESDVVPMAGAPRSEWLALEVERTHARMNLALLAALSYCRTTGRPIPTQPSPIVKAGRAQPLRAHCAMRSEKELLEDAWGQPIIWKTESGHLTLTSAGPDGRLGTIDDIRSPPSSPDSSMMVDVATFCSG